jgi:hypothetical protein
MKLTLIALILLSTSAFAAPGLGEVSNTSGTSTLCCPTGTCSDKNIPVCAGVTDRRQRDDVPRSAPKNKKGKSVPVKIEDA